MSVKFDVAKGLNNWDGKPVLMQTDEKDGEGKPVIVPMSFGYAACEALGAIYEGERGLSGDEKLKRFRLGVKLSGANGLPVDLTSEEAALLKKVVALRYGPLFMGQIWDAIDPPKTTE